MTFPYKLIDLTHPLGPNTPSWTGSCGFSHDIKLDYDEHTTDVSFRVQQIKMHAGVGTHMDAPAHIIPGGLSIDQLSIDHFLAPCVVINVSDQAHERYSISTEDINQWESTHGPIPSNAFVICYTGWDRFWDNPKQYHNNHVFPAVSGSAAQMLLDRNIVGLGIDTMSPDRPEDKEYAVHAALLGAGKYIVENVAYAASLPPVGAYSLALPIKTIGGTEAPIRLVGLMII